MPDIPVEIEGNADGFTIFTQATRNPQTGPRTVRGDTFQLDPGGVKLQMRFTNAQKVDLTLPLGEGWLITIEPAAIQE